MGIKALSALLLLLAGAPARAEVCFDTTTIRSDGRPITIWNREPSTSTFKTPASTTTLKLDLHKKLTAAEYDLAFMSWMWRGQVFFNHDQQKTIQALMDEVQKQKDILAECRRRCP
jgi:hypothetical protein